MAGAETRAAKKGLACAARGKTAVAQGSGVCGGWWKISEVDKPIIEGLEGERNDFILRDCVLEFKGCCGKPEKGNIQWRVFFIAEQCADKWMGTKLEALCGVDNLHTKYLCVKLGELCVNNRIAPLEKRHLHNYLNQLLYIANLLNL